MRIIETEYEIQDVGDPWKTDEEIIEDCCTQSWEGVPITEHPHCEVTRNAWEGFSGVQQLEMLEIEIDEMGRDSQGRYVYLEHGGAPMPCGEEERTHTPVLDCCNGIWWDYEYNPTLVSMGSVVSLRLTGTGGHRITYVSGHPHFLFMNGQQVFTTTSTTINVFINSDGCGIGYIFAFCMDQGVNWTLLTNDTWATECSEDEDIVDYCYSPSCPFGSHNNQANMYSRANQYGADPSKYINRDSWWMIHWPGMIYGCGNISHGPNDQYNFVAVCTKHDLPDPVTGEIDACDRYNLTEADLPDNINSICTQWPYSGGADPGERWGPWDKCGCISFESKYLPRQRLAQEGYWEPQPVPYGYKVVIEDDYKIVAAAILDSFHTSFCPDGGCMVLYMRKGYPGYHGSTGSHPDMTHWKSECRGPYTLT